MAKAKKRNATRKQVPKRRRLRVKSAGKKSAKSKTQKKRTAKARAKMAPRKSPKQMVPVIEDTIIDVIDEPIPGVVRVTEYETIRTTNPKPDARSEAEE